MRILYFLGLFYFCASSAFAIDELATPIFDEQEMESITQEVAELPPEEAPALAPAPIVQIAPVNINPNRTLSENLAANPTNDGSPNITIPGTQGTWVEKINFTPAEKKEELTPQLTVGDNLEKVVIDSKKSTSTQKRSNASVFDISGVMLRMNILQAEEVLRKKGFKKINQAMEIPNFIKWRNEEKCRQTGVVGYERLANCVVKLSQKDNYQYIENAQYTKYDTGEEVHVFMTSNFTNNKIYRIMYKSISANIKGNSQKSLYLRNIKIYDFWRKINQKYGAPDNKEDITWGLGENKPYLKAATGFLVLEDPMLKELDWTRMSREDQKFLNTDLYTF